MIQAKGSPASRRRTISSSAVGVARRRLDQHRGLVVGRDAPGRRQAAGHGGGGVVGAQLTGRGWCA